MKNGFTFNTELNKFERDVLSSLPNLKDNEIINKCNNLGDIQMLGNDTKNLLLIHVILAASDSAKIKIRECLRVDQMSKPFTEQTKMG